MIKKLKNRIRDAWKVLIGKKSIEDLERNVDNLTSVVKEMNEKNAVLERIVEIDSQILNKNIKTEIAPVHMDIASKQARAAHLEQNKVIDDYFNEKLSKIFPPYLLELYKDTKSTIPELEATINEYTDLKECTFGRTIKIYFKGKRIGDAEVKTKQYPDHHETYLIDNM